MASVTQNVSLSEREKAKIQAKAEALGMSISRLMVIAALEYEPTDPDAVADLLSLIEDHERRLSSLEELALR